MPSEHYFSAEPAGDFKSRQITVQLNGESVNLKTAGGVFSPEHIDLGTQILLQHIDRAPREGDILDLGCGWGPIALSLARQSPEARIWALDINERALALVRENANHLGCKNVRAVREDEIAADLRFSGIWSNPPIRIGKAQLHNLLETWIPRLKPGAAAYLVVQKHLGSDSLQRWLGDRFADEFEVDRIDSQKTFRILRVQRNPQ